MVIAEIQADIAAIVRDAALREEAHFTHRAEALDFLEFHVIDRIEGLLQTPNPPTGLHALQQAAQNVKHTLEAIDAALFQRLRTSIRTGSILGAPLLILINSYVGRRPGSAPQQPVTGYDSLDIFTNGLLPAQDLPSETHVREPEMVYYQKTPARIIFELVEKARLKPADVFYDLGSGLGHVPILVNVLSGTTAKGIEVEPAYCAYATACATALHLTRVTFTPADARTADYSDGTVFYLYTPFEGHLLQQVVQRLRAEARCRRITLFTYGPCTLHIAQEPWLQSVGPAPQHVYQLGEFSSLPIA